MTEVQLDQPTDGRDLGGADLEVVRKPASRWNRLPKNAVPPNSRWGRRARRLTVAAVVVLGLLNIADAIPPEPSSSTPPPAQPRPTRSRRSCSPMGASST